MKDEAVKQIYYVIAAKTKDKTLPATPELHVCYQRPHRLVDRTVQDSNNFSSRGLNLLEKAVLFLT